MTVAVACTPSVTWAKLRAAATEEQFVGVQPLLAVEDGLSSEKKLVGGCVAHENSLKR